VNLIQITSSQLVDEIVNPYYFNLYDMYSVMFGVEEVTSTGTYYETYRDVLPFFSHGHLNYEAQPDRQSFCRLLWDRHSHFSIVVDFSYRNWIFYNLADINWSITESQVEQVWQHIDQLPSGRLLGMRERTYYN